MRRALLAILMMATTTAASADDWHTRYTTRFSATYWECQRQGGMGDFIYTKCADEEYHRRDRELNAVYRRKIATLPADAAQHLRLSQRAWIVHRDATCNRIYQAEPGTNALHLTPQCLADETIRRTIWLEKLR